MNNVPEKLTPSRDLKQCAICARRFASDRIKVHENICKKSSAIVRKSFDVTQQRIRGTEAEKFIKQPGKIDTANPNEREWSPSLATNWRWKHEDFIKKIREAKMCLMEKNRKLSDLPLPPPLDFEDPVQCPHCLRQFNKTSAERHICMCSNMVYKMSKSKASFTKNSKLKASVVDK